MEFVDTRSGKDLKVNWKQAIFAGKIGSGLITPRHLPEPFPKEELDSLLELSFPDLAAKIIARFFVLSESEISQLTARAYSSQNWDTEEIIPIATTGKIFRAEQWHGKTAAFKDIALSWLPLAMQEALADERSRQKKDNLKVLILGATSGDTGSAGEAGFADANDIAIAIAFPESGKVTEIQKRQMIEFQTPDGRISVYSITDNFDYCQNVLAKPILDDNEFRDELLERFSFQLTSLNSINIGRIVPQIVTFFKAYQAIRAPFDVCVPAGNFGHTLSAYFAKKMGAPIQKIVVATNENDVLHRFFQTGQFSLGKFHVTNSPSMDITIPSNLERLLYYVGGPEKTSQWLTELKNSGQFTIDPDVLKKLTDDFDSGTVSETETLEEIKSVWESSSRLIDPHSAVASRIAQQKKRPDIAMLTLETAHWGKFIQTIFEALQESGGQDIPGPWEITGMQKIDQLIAKNSGAPRLTSFLSNLQQSQKAPRQSGIHPDKKEMQEFLRIQLTALALAS